MNMQQPARRMPTTGAGSWRGAGATCQEQEVAAATRYATAACRVNAASC